MKTAATVIGAYIAGRILGAIHVGEIVRFDSPPLIKQNPTCTCGKQICACSFWKEVDQDSYARVIESIASNGYEVIVDSSKPGETPTVDGVDVIPIHLRSRY